MLHEKHAAWLATRGIPLDLASQYGMHTHSDGRAQWLRLPFDEAGKTINHKWRQTVAKRFQMDPGAPLLLWNHAALAVAAQTGEPLIICEGEMDGLSAVLAGHSLCVSVPNGAPKDVTDNPWEATRYEWVNRHRVELDRVTKFILATDNDSAGLSLAADLARLLGAERCMFVTYQDGCKDLNEVLLGHGVEGVRLVLETAKDYPVKGLYRLSQFPELPDFTPVSVGIPGLEDLFPLVTGTFTVITGWAGHGKSSLLFAMLAHLIGQGVPMALGSFETLPKPILIRALRAAMLKVPEGSKAAATPCVVDLEIEKYLSIISNLGVDDDTDLDIEYILELGRVAVLRDGIRLLVLDPWNEIEHKRRSHETETEYVGRAIRAIKRFAKDYDCAVWVVAHPRKPQSDGNPKAPSLYDLAGSANFANKADYGLVVHRDDLANTMIDARLVKKRRGLPGAVGKVDLTWCWRTSSYELVSG